MILTHPAWVLETELRSPGRALSSLNHWPSLTWVGQRGKKICTGTLQNSVSEKFYEAINLALPNSKAAKEGNILSLMTLTSVFPVLI